MDHEAARAANHLWRLAGFAPTTDPQSAAEFHVFSQVFGRVRAWMHAQGITPETVRGSLHALSEHARTEGQQLYDFVAQGAVPCGGMAWVLNSPAACQAYVLAIMLSVQGTLSADEEGRERRSERERPQWQTRGHPGRRGERREERREDRREERSRRGESGRPERRRAGAEAPRAEAPSRPAAAVHASDL